MSTTDKLRGAGGLTERTDWPRSRRWRWWRTARGDPPGGAPHGLGGTLEIDETRCASVGASIRRPGRAARWRRGWRGRHRRVAAGRDRGIAGARCALARACGAIRGGHRRHADPAAGGGKKKKRQRSQVRAGFPAVPLSTLGALRLEPVGKARSRRRNGERVNTVGRPNLMPGVLPAVAAGRGDDAAGGGRATPRPTASGWRPAATATRATRPCRRLIAPLGLIITLVESPSW